jgi:hypothetical protein
LAALLHFQEQESRRRRTTEKEGSVMTKHLRVTLAAVVGLTWCIGISTAQADEWNRETILKIDQPMLVPGATLVAGT